MRSRFHRMHFKRKCPIECALCGEDIVPSERIRNDVFGSFYHAKCGLRVLKCMHRNVKKHPALHTISQRFRYFLQFVHPRFLGIYMEKVHYRTFPCLGEYKSKPSNSCCAKCKYNTAGSLFNRIVCGRKYCNACGKTFGLYVKKGKKIEDTMIYLLNTYPELEQYVRADVKRALLKGH